MQNASGHLTPPPTVPTSPTSPTNTADTSGDWVVNIDSDLEKPAFDEKSSPLCAETDQSVG